MGSTAGPAWIGYAVPKAAGSGNSCCYSDGSRGCGLEGDSNFTNTNSKSGPVQLEGDTLRRDPLPYRPAFAVQKVRHFSLDCDLDAGGLPFIWLTGVKPAESLSML